MRLTLRRTRRIHRFGLHLLPILALLAAAAPSPAQAGAPPPLPEGPTTEAEAARFLAQASFGPTPAQIKLVARIGMAEWFRRQTEIPRQQTHLKTMLGITRTWRDPDNPDFDPTPGDIQGVHESLWRAYITGPDQLRQRMAYALGQIFVVSSRNPQVNWTPRAFASYADLLDRNAFGTVRTLLTDVTLHPSMGLMLSHLGNRKGDPASGRIPDQNFAREVMQLFSIGLVQLNPDGTPKRLRGRKIPTYTQDDVVGVSRIVTGLHFHGYDDWNEWKDYRRLYAPQAMPMQGYADWHEPGVKRFLGRRIPAREVAAPMADVTLLIETLVDHPNIGPFLSKQLIQKFVTSNPSPGYVERVTEVFNDNGRGQKGDFKAVLQAILADPEARSPEAAARPTFGKIREPILRFTHLLRNLDPKARIGFPIPYWMDDPAWGIGQVPLRAPSVFNFYRNAYAPPGSAADKAGLVAPEMQILNESSLNGWQSFIGWLLWNREIEVEESVRNVRLTLSFDAWKPFARDRRTMLQQVARVFYAGAMPDGDREALGELFDDAGEDLDARIRDVLWGVMISAEYLVQR